MRLSKEEILRKGLHALALLIPFGIYYFPDRLVAVLLPAAAALFLCADLLRLKAPQLGGWVAAVFGPFMRASERTRLTGASYVFISGVCCYYLFEPAIAFIALSFVILGDAVAALVGIPLGRTRIGRKSLEGSLGCFAACMAFWYVFPHIPVLPALAVAVLTALLELLPVPVDDNLYVPLATGLVLRLWIG